MIGGIRDRVCLQKFRRYIAIDYFHQHNPPSHPCHRASVNKEAVRCQSVGYGRSRGGTRARV